MIQLSHFAVIHLFMTPAEQYFKTSRLARDFFHFEKINYLGITFPESSLVTANDCAGGGEAVGSGFV